LHTPNARKYIFAALSILIGLGLAFGLSEVALRILGIGYGNSPLVSHPSLHHAHPADYTFVSHDPNGEYGGHTVYYDDDGLVADPAARKKEEADEQNEYKIAVMGDSFAEALQVDFTRSFAGLLAASGTDSATVKNYGVSSYSPIFYGIQWQEIVADPGLTHAVVLLYSNDIGSDQNMAETAERSESGTVVALPGPGDDWLVTQLRKSYLVRFIRKIQMTVSWVIANRGRQQSVVDGAVEENPDISPLSSELMLELAARASDAGVEFAVMVVPSKYRLRNRIFDSDDPQFSDKWQSWAQANQVLFVDLVAPFEAATKNGKDLFFEQDIHFNELGHVIVARAVKAAFPDLFPGEIAESNEKP
jgi:hypothetical protein